MLTTCTCTADGSDKTTLAYLPISSASGAKIKLLLQAINARLLELLKYLWHAYVVRKAADKDAVSCQFTHIGAVQLQYLRRYSVLLHQWLLGIQSYTVTVITTSYNNCSSNLQSTM